MPERIQLRRTAGWRKPEGAIVVARPSKWGNPYTIAAIRKHLDEFGMTGTDEELRELVVDMFRSDLTFGQDSPFWWFGPHMQMIAINGALQTGELRGRDLACWCPLVDAVGNRVPCHADVLLELANAPNGDEPTR